MASGSQHLCVPTGTSIPDAAVTDASVGDAAIADAPVAASYEETVRADKPIGYWRLGDASATTAADDSGRGATGVISSGVTIGVQGALVQDPDPAMAFDGQSGSISLGAGFDFTGSAPFSIEAWIKPALLDTEFRHIFTKQHRVSPREGYALVLHDGSGDQHGLFFERFVGDKPVADTSKDASFIPSTAGFTHVVATYDGAHMQLYANGKLVATVLDPPPHGSVVDPALIGASGSSGGFFDGTIDEVAVYPAALSPDRIKAHYEAGSGMMASARTDQR